MGKLFWVNVITFCSLAICTTLFLFLEKTHGLQILQSFLLLVIILPLTGLNLTVVIEKLSRQKFDLLERANITAIAALVFLPFLLTFEYSKFHILFPALPIINALVIFLLAIWINPLALENAFDRSFLKEKFFRSFTLAALLYLAGLFTIALSYYPLPDLDPYYWLSKYSEDFSQNKLTYLSLYRPLFSSLAYLFSQTAHVDLYAFFKYALPFLTLLVLLPVALVARLFHKYTEQLTIFLLPLASASLILYFQIPIPQAILNIILTYFIFFLLYSWLAEKNFFYFLAGVSIFSTYFYHEAAALILLPWLLVTLYQYRGPLFRKAAANRLSTLLILFLALSYSTLVIDPIYNFFFSWLVRGIDMLHSLHPNFAFPATYVNIDGNAVGWGDWVGVIKYYTFYVGPAVLFAFFLLLWNLRTSGSSLSREVCHKKEFLVLGSAFLIFFSIAEVLPRFLNIALLPERAWGFAGLIFLALIPILFKYRPNHTSWTAPLFIVAILINVGGALYINTLKAYLITPTQISSAEWISGTLPENRVLFTYGNKNLLKIHAQSKVISIQSPEFYSDIRVFDTSLDTFLGKNNDLKQRYSNALKGLSDELRGLRGENLDTDIKKITARLHSLSQASATLENTLSTVTDSHPDKNLPLYIYYAKISDRNPYTNRPYYKEGLGSSFSSLVFDRYPERFKRVYALPDDEIVIWRLTDTY